MISLVLTPRYAATKTMAWWGSTSCARKKIFARGLIRPWAVFVGEIEQPSLRYQQIAQFQVHR